MAGIYELVVSIERQTNKTNFLIIKMIQTVKTRFGEEKIEMIMSNQFGPIPKIVYKYRSWGEFIEGKWEQNINSKNIIEKQEIYIPSPKHFNDPFDCKIPIAYDLISKDLIIARKFFERVLFNNFPNLSSLEKEQRVIELMATRQKYDENYVDQFNSETESILENQMSVYCVTPLNNNILMWAHYAASHTGICIGFNSNKIFNYFRIGSMVEYKDSYPIISPAEDHYEIEDIKQQFYTKSSHWDYEIEYRLMTINEPARIIKLADKTIINEVIIGYLMNQEKKEELISLIKKELPHVTIFETKKHRTKFELVLTPIS